jgi:GDPmannose 4,6-dehydratase
LKKALVTGVSGQDGAYLAHFLLTKGYEVYGGFRRTSHDDSYRLKVLGIDSDVIKVNFDLTDRLNVFEVISKNQFDEVYNLAAQSFVGSSWDLPLQTSEVNGMGALNLIDAVRRFSSHSKFYQASTSEMFGLIQEDLQNEATPFYPRSPYGVAKLFAHWMVKNYRESYGLHASNGILFNHESPLRGIEFVTKKITTQLAQIRRGERETLLLGNLNAQRDWGYAREYIEAMWLMTQQEAPDDYVVATGVTSTVRQFVEYAASAIDFDLEWVGEGVSERGVDRASGRVVVEVSPTFFRPAEVDILIGDASKARDALGWQPQTTVQELAELMVQFDLEGTQISP